MQSSDKAEPLLQPRRPSRRSSTLGCCYCIFLVQYAVQFMISPFFPTSPAGKAIGIRLVGAVFAAYPLATVIATPFVPSVLRALGMRRAIPAGLCVTALGSLLFGLLPSFVSSPLALSIGLICFRCLGGLGAAVSETGCLTVLGPHVHCARTTMHARTHCKHCNMLCLGELALLYLGELTLTPNPSPSHPHQMISTGEAMEEEQGHLGVALSSVEVSS